MFGLTASSVDRKPSSWLTHCIRCKVLDTEIQTAKLKSETNCQVILFAVSQCPFENEIRVHVPGRYSNDCGLIQGEYKGEASQKALFPQYGNTYPEE